MFQLYRWFSIRDVDIKAVRLISKKPGNLLSDCGVSVVGLVCMTGLLICHPHPNIFFTTVCDTTDMCELIS